MAVDREMICRNVWRLIEHRAKSPERCSRALAKGLDRPYLDSTFANRLRDYGSVRRVCGVVVVVVLGAPEIVVVVVVVVGTGGVVVVVVVVGIVAS